MKVHYTDPGEFLAELARDGPPSRIVRLTRSYTPAGQLPIHHVRIVAGYTNARGELVELSRYVGDHWGGGFRTTDETDQEGAQVQESIERAAQELGYEVRAGRLEE